MQGHRGAPASGAQDPLEREHVARVVEVGRVQVQAKRPARQRGAEAQQRGRGGALERTRGAQADGGGEPELVYPEKKSEFPFLDALKNGASAAGAGLAKGALDGVAAKAGLQNGVQFLAPGLVPSL